MSPTLDDLSYRQKLASWSGTVYWRITAAIFSFVLSLQMTHKPVEAMNRHSMIDGLSGTELAATTESGSTEHRLLQTILKNYDTDARGVHVNDTVTVSIQLLLLRIQGLDERSQVLTTTGLIICDWQDDRLKWNKEKFDYLEDIVIKPERIWLPELALMNGADELAPDFRKVRVLIRHDGHVHWEPGGVFTTTCDIDIRYFPFDDQSCPIQFGAWAYYSSRMNITNDGDVVQTLNFRLNGEWAIYSTRAQWHENVLPCCPNTRYPYVEFTLYLRRRHTFYVMNIIVPCTLLSVLVMVVFCLPPDAGEKISLGISVLLAFTVFLLMVAENVPRTSLHTPIIVIYLTCTMALGTVSVCLTVCVLNLHHRDAECPVPRLARIIVLHYLAGLLRVGARKPRTMAGNLLLEPPDERRLDLKAGLRRIARGMGLLRPPLRVNGYAQGGGTGDSFHPRRSVSFGGTATAYYGTSGVLRAESVFDGSGELTHRRRSTNDGQQSRPRGDHTHDWKELAHVLDRLFFIIVLLFMTASAMIIILVPYYKEELIT